MLSARTLFEKKYKQKNTTGSSKDWNVFNKKFTYETTTNFRAFPLIPMTQLPDIYRHLANWPI